MEKYALFIFPGLITRETLIDEIYNGNGLLIKNTEKIQHIPEPGLVKGIQFDNSNNHIVELYDEEVDAAVDAFHNTDANIFILPWSSKIIKRLVAENANIIAFKVAGKLRHYLVGRAVCKYMDEAWLYNLKSDYEYYNKLFSKNNTLYITKCNHLLDKYTLIYTLNYTFRKIADPSNKNRVFKPCNYDECNIDK